MLSKVPCPICGSLMSKRSHTCRSCRDKDPSAILRYPVASDVLPDGRGELPSICDDKLSSDWLREFAGLFMGEGYVRFRRTPSGSYVVGLGMGLRADDREALEDIQSHLGGSLANRGGSRTNNTKPVLRWSINRQDQVGRVCEFLLCHSSIPMRKLQELRLVLDFIRWRKSQPFHVKDWSYAEDCLSRLKQIRDFKVPS